MRRLSLSGISTPIIASFVLGNGTPASRRLI
jgi:hypothetical protein